MSKPKKLQIRNSTAELLVFTAVDAERNTVRELQRQIASSLYHRLALSRDKDEIRRLVRRMENGKLRMENAQ